MTFGYVTSVQNPRPWRRVVFIAGAALAFWAHFVLVLPLAGLAAGHLALPALRRRYAIGAFAFDLLLIAAACMPAWPYVAAAAGRPQHVSWLSTPRHGDALALLAPFAVAFLAGTYERNGEARDVRWALWASILAMIVVVEAALPFGADLVAVRYVEPILVPAAVLAGCAMTAMRPRDLVMSLTAFLAINGANVARTFYATGTFSGLGVEDWRTSSAAVRRAVRDTGARVVLLRSGFVEESLPSPGVAHPATRAVLDGPNESPLNAEIVSLTYRWSEAGRASYFSSMVAPEVRRLPAFVLIAQHAVDTDGPYTANAVEWVDRTFSGRFAAVPIAAGRGVDVYLFLRR